jgi:hypothetical protein
MPKQHAPEGTTLPAPPTAPDGQRWRCPVVLRVKAVVIAAAAVAVAVVFFPPWFGIPVAVVSAAWGLGLAVLGASAVVDRGAGVLVLRTGLIARRVRLTDVTAVLVDDAKVSIARANGGEVSMYAWRQGPLDALLRVPLAAGDIGHAISSAVALAKAAEAPGADADAARPAPAGGTPARTRSRLATALLGGAGVLAIVGALVVRVHWHNPALTVLSVILALALGVAGLLYLLVALWILLTGRAPRTTLRP